MPPGPGSTSDPMYVPPSTVTAPVPGHRGARCRRPVRWRARRAGASHRRPAPRRPSRCAPRRALHRHRRRSTCCRSRRRRRAALPASCTRRRRGAVVAGTSVGAAVVSGGLVARRRSTPGPGHSLRVPAERWWRLGAVVDVVVDVLVVAGRRHRERCRHERARQLVVAGATHQNHDEGSRNRQFPHGRSLPCGLVRGGRDSTCRAIARLRKRTIVSRAAWGLEPTWRPSSDARVSALRPNRSRSESTVVSRGVWSLRPKGSSSCSGIAVAPSSDIRLPTDSPSRVRPRCSIVSISARRIELATAAIGFVDAVGWASERARVGASEVVVAEAQRDGTPGAPGGAHPPRHAVDDAEQQRFDRLVRLRAASASPTATRSTPGGDRSRPPVGPDCGPGRTAGDLTPRRGSTPVAPGRGRQPHRRCRCRDR